eukprot:gb/GFBE01080864.1/.p1 GENE.gb/GFBE01080864.1/~~gb/GFBE01080864.1/.p1  ORF type:complete len:438 (+),score=82.24 gb/GFBE01080864.1/:1-1314(+)
MASEVAPCMPLQLFRRATGAGQGRREANEGGNALPAGGGGSGGEPPCPQEICHRLNEDLKSLAEADAESGGAHGQNPLRDQLVKKSSEDIKRQLQALLEVLEDTAERGETIGSKAVGGVVPSPQNAGEVLLNQFLVADLPARLVAGLGQLEFEVRKDVVTVFSAIVRLGAQVGADQQLQQYTQCHPKFFELLVDGYEKPEIATHCGMMLRSCARHSRLVEAFLSQTKVALKLITFTRHESFDISTDAFSSLHDFLLTHHALSARFLEDNFRDFFALYNGLLEHGDYVTQRQALKLLSDMLLERKFMRVMMAYIEDEQFLQIHMNLLRADSKAIQLEAFHVFKIFVANPQKPPRVQHILYKNKDRLVMLLEGLKANRSDDKQFDEDKNTVISKLQALEPPPKAPNPGTAPGGYQAAKSPKPPSPDMSSPPTATSPPVA